MKDKIKKSIVGTSAGILFALICTSVFSVLVPGKTDEAMQQFIAFGIIAPTSLFIGSGITGFVSKKYHSNNPIWQILLAPSTYLSVFWLYLSAGTPGTYWDSVSFVVVTLGISIIGIYLGRYINERWNWRVPIG
jgi:hypothetical protein